MTEADLPKVTIYTDGACKPNPGPGGWAAILLFPGQKPKELVGSEQNATNNRMELYAAIQALASLSRPHRVHLYTDSNYLRQGLTRWMAWWKTHNWRTRTRSEVKNRDLWQLLASQMEQHQVVWHWTRGHVGNRWNERADSLAASAIARAKLPLDDDKAIHIFTAASFVSGLHKGGWAVVLRFGKRVKTLSGSEFSTSGNSMHIRAAIEGLRALKKSFPVHLYTTSCYLKDGITVWVDKWSENNWKTKDGKPVRYRELWETLISLVQEYRIRWHVVPQSNLPEEMIQARQLASQAAHSDTN